MTARPLARPRNFTKAQVTLEERAGRDVVVKDFSARPFIVRLLFGRPTLRREARAYARLSGIEGVPRCIGLEGPDRLVLEWVEGRPIDEEQELPLPREFFRRARELLDAVHARGVAVADLHRSNLLVSADGRVFLIDLAQARLAARPGKPRPLVRALMRLDDHALERIEARHYGEPEPLPEGLFGAVYRAGKRVKKWLPSLR